MPTLSSIEATEVRMRIRSSLFSLPLRVIKWEFKRVSSVTSSLYSPGNKGDCAREP